KIVVLNSEEELQKLVRNSVQKEFEPWVICNCSARDETAPENAVISFLEYVPVTNDITNIVRFLTHHDTHAIPMRATQAPDDCSPESMRPGILRRRQIGDAELQLLQDLPGVVGASIVHGYDLVRHIMLT